MKQSRYEIIQKPLLNLREVMDLCGVGYKKAIEIRTLVEQDISPQKLVNGLIPLKHIVRVMNIDLDLIIKLARS